MLMQSAYSREGSLWLTSRAVEESKVLEAKYFGSLLLMLSWTLTYLHECIAKKTARMVSCNITHCISVIFLGGDGFLFLFFGVSIVEGS